MKNRLFYGDNLDILRDYIADESVDLIYLDPPFNSNRNYNVLFQEKSGQDSASQIQAFEDTWKWDENAAKAYYELTTTPPESVASMIGAIREFVGSNDMMAYLVMMAQRMKELHRVLKPTDSLYLHCDPTASHYLKVLLDTVFGPKTFRNEIIWRRTGSHGKTARYAPIHDVILFYTKSDDYTWNSPKRPYMRGHVEENFVKDENGIRTNYYGNVLTGSGTRNGESGKPWRGVDPTAKGRHWAIPGAVAADLLEAGVDISELSQHEKLDVMYEHGYITMVEGQTWPVYQRYIRPTDGQALSDIWAYQPYTEGTVFGTDEGIDADVRWLSPRDQERLGYPTQKPRALLERIIQASSNEGDVVLDPFCGCGTTIVAAQKLNRRWMGIDITHLAISLIRQSLIDHFGKEIESEIEVVREPTDVASARALFEATLYQFEWWALSLVRAMPGNNKKKGADRGVDGLIYFHVDNSGKPQKAIVQVKGGKVQASVIRDLRGTMMREKAAMAILITLQPPTSHMRQEAVNAGFYETPLGRTYPAIQILTIDELLDGKEPRVPRDQTTFKQAGRISRNQQPALDLGDL